MKTQYVKLTLSIFLIAMVAVALGFSSQSAFAGSQPAQAAPAADGGTISSAQDGIASTAAAKPWTLAEMKAAKPYPLTVADTSKGIFSDVNLGPNGPAGFAAGSKGGATADLAADEVAAAVNPAGYGYPSPFVRFPVNRIAAYTTYPFRTVGKLFFTQYGSNYVCSASVIANKGIVTAGHCVHAGNGYSSGWSYNVVFVPAYSNGSAPYGAWSVSTLVTFTDWYYHGAASDLDHDWGIGRVAGTRSGKYIGQTVGYLGYAWNQTANNAWWLLGYPAASPFNGAYMYACNSSYAYNSPFYSGGPAPIVVGCDQTGGTSGGPWILSFTYGNYVNSVNSHRATVRPKELAGPYADSSTPLLLNQARAW
jgi:V8-like Glu-specific endopeptidase